jgi:hypothetical protein
MYHYTSTGAVEGILRSRRMWAFDLRAMNDPQELTYGAALIDERFEAALSAPDLGIVAQWLSHVRRLFHELLPVRSSTFSISLSEHPDMARQWRNYAGGGKGVALGWSIDSDYPGGPLKMWVTYDRERQARLVDGLLAFHAKYLAERFAHGTTRASAEEAWETASFSLFKFLSAVWLTFKSKAWEPESEFRIVYHVWDEALPSWCQILLKETNGTSRRYIEADFRPVDLEYVILGPDIEQSAPSWLSKLLRETGYLNAKVRRSELSSEP